MSKTSFKVALFGKEPFFITVPTVDVGEDVDGKPNLVAAGTAVRHILQRGYVRRDSNGFSPDDVAPGISDKRAERLERLPGMGAVRRNV